MKNQIGTSLVLAAFFCGCATTIPVSEYTRKQDFFEKINKTARLQMGRIVQLDGQETYGKNIHVSPDSTSWTDDAEILKRTVPTSSIREITFYKHFSGAVQGLFLGMVSGTVLGALQVLSNPDYYQDVPGIAYVIMWGIVGGPVGLLVGGGIGSRDKFILTDSTLESERMQDTKAKEK